MWCFISITIVFISLCQNFSEVPAASANDPRPRIHLSDVDELTKTLLFHHDDPFAEDDKWSAVSANMRRKWLEANYVLPSTLSPSNLLESTRHIARSLITTHVDVHIIAHPKLLTPRRSSQISHYSTAMRAGRNGTTLNFTVSIAPSQIFERLALQNYTHTSASLSSVLKPLAQASGALNLLYVIVNSPKHQLTEYAASVPFLLTDRAALFIYTPDKSSELIVTDMLAATERAAQRLFTPELSYFPIPFVRSLQVVVTAYTPFYSHRALWLRDFSWDDFETSVRAHVLPGQKVRFVSSQTNGECKQCERAFQFINKTSDSFIRNAVLALNGGAPPNHTWAAGVEHPPTVRIVPPDTFRLFVLDTAKVRKSESLARLENHQLFTFPGIAILIIRSSDPSCMATLRLSMIRAVVASLFGFQEPILFIPDVRNMKGKLFLWPQKPSPLLIDVATRYTVRSLLEHQAGRLEEIFDGMIYFEVDPTQSLEKYDYEVFIQRLNFLLFKLRKAQDALSNGDMLLAMYLATASAHDTRAIYAVFDIDEERRALKRFRDPTIRCHFSRLQREALRASEIIESTYSSIRSKLIAVASFFMSALITNVVIRLASKKWRRKRE